MKTIKKQFALIEYKRAQLESYNPEIVKESDSLEELEDYDTGYEGPTNGFTIVERTNRGLIDYYTGELFRMNSYD